jgi:ABC-type nitrate/sulfonate/bicarbonate transport system substrate-binding protein
MAPDKRQSSSRIYALDQNTLSCEETAMGKIVASLIVIITFIFALQFGDVAAQPLIRVGYSGTGVAKNLHKTIERSGLWKKRGLDVRLIYFTSGATMAQAMV